MGSHINKQNDHMHIHIINMVSFLFMTFSYINDIIVHVLIEMSYASFFDWIPLFSHLCFHMLPHLFCLIKAQCHFWKFPIQSNR